MTDYTDLVKRLKWMRDYCIVAIETDDENDRIVGEEVFKLFRDGAVRVIDAIEALVEERNILSFASDLRNDAAEQSAHLRHDLTFARERAEAAEAEVLKWQNAAASHEHEKKATEAEVTRLRAGGCARDQTTTQWCAEAVALQAEIDTLEADALDTQLGAEHCLKQRNELRKWVEMAKAALQIIAGIKPPPDNLMGNSDFARIALAELERIGA